MKLFFAFIIAIVFISCNKTGTSINPPGSFTATKITINDSQSNSFIFYYVSLNSIIKFAFSAPVQRSTVEANVSFTTKAGSAVSNTIKYENSDSTIIIQPAAALQYLTGYIVSILPGIRSVNNDTLQNNPVVYLTTQIDSSDKFTRISDSALLTLVQQQTFKYFWDFGHPVSGLARERTTSGDIVTTGGTGFGVMSILVAINRNFISRTDGLIRIQKIVTFYKNNCTSFHGAYAHWINGTTGATIPFSTKDDGADLVETSYLMQGLLCARQYFNGADAAETSLRNNINELWNAVEWNWFRQNNQNVLYWHWSPNYGWELNVQIRGWNEALIVYALAASSNTSAIPKNVYDEGWAQNGAIKNGNTYYGVQLPLGPPLGGPLFFAHYSFLGINPDNLADAYANYWIQNVSHTQINYNYCVANPKNFYGYSNQCWGLTASDDNFNFYNAHEPNNDDGVITPTAAISSLPYTPVQSLNALRFFYYKLGDKLWGEYGFKDAFNLTEIWFDSESLAIDQGPEIIMIENYRSKLLWNLFMSCPEVKRGMKALGFTSPYL